MLFNGPFIGFRLMVLEARRRSVKEEGLKESTPKQRLQEWTIDTPRTGFELTQNLSSGLVE